jgi:excisionase family DNA binding protein
MRNVIDTIRDGLETGISDLRFTTERVDALAEVLAKRVVYNAYLTLEEAAAYLKVSEETIKRKVAAGKIVPVRRVRGSKTLFTMDELNRYVLDECA